MSSQPTVVDPAARANLLPVTIDDTIVAGQIYSCRENKNLRGWNCGEFHPFYLSPVKHPKTGF